MLYCSISDAATGDSMRAASTPLACMRAASTPLACMRARIVHMLQLETVIFWSLRASFSTHCARTLETRTLGIICRVESLDYGEVNSTVLATRIWASSMYKRNNIEEKRSVVMPVAMPAIQLTHKTQKILQF